MAEHVWMSAARMHADLIFDLWPLTFGLPSRVFPPWKEVDNLECFIASLYSISWQTFLIRYSHKSQLPVGSPNSSCENVALDLSMSYNFYRTNCTVVEKRSHEKTTYYHNSLSLLPLLSSSSYPASIPLFFLLSPSLHPGKTHITIHCNALHCI